MPVDQTLSARATHAQRVADAALAGADLRELDRLVHSVTTELGCEIASLSLLSDRQLMLSACGLDRLDIARGDTSPFDDTICSNALRCDGPLIIPDARNDARVSSTPAVREGIVAAYLGIPLVQDGHVIGVLCTVAGEPRAWTATETTRMQEIGFAVTAELARVAADGVPVAHPVDA